MALMKKDGLNIWVEHSRSWNGGLLAQRPNEVISIHIAWFKTLNAIHHRETPLGILYSDASHNSRLYGDHYYSALQLHDGA